MMEVFLENKTLNKDKLTNLFSREVIEEYAKFLIEQNIPFSIALIDIDNFKYINDTYGHQIGDKVIQRVAKELNEKLTALKSFIGRFGGDEFIFILPKITDYDNVWSICNTLLQNVDSLRFADFPDLFVTCTIGISRFGTDAKTFDELFEKADKALYRGKTKGRSCFIIYLKEKHEHINIQGLKASSLSSMNLHATIFKLLSATDNLDSNIDSLFSFLSSYLMIDHLCVQTKEKLLYQKIHPLTELKNFLPIDEDLIKKTISNSSEIFYLTDLAQLIQAGQTDLAAALESQGILSTFFCSISYKDKFYGFLRADATNTRRIWQYCDMDLLLTTAKTIALMKQIQSD